MPEKTHIRSALVLEGLPEAAVKQRALEGAVVVVGVGGKRGGGWGVGGGGVGG